MGEVNQYVVLEWVDELPGYPRYSFATITHAEELSPNVQWLQMCASLETAAKTARELNLRQALGEQSRHLE
jgi:hypothetical protein